MLQFFDLTINSDEIDIPEATVEMPRTRGKVVQATLGSIINWILTRQLYFYLYNRGDGRVSNSTAKSAAEGINSDIIGECTIGRWQIEDENGNTKTVMCLNNFHSRLYGAILRLRDGNLTTREKNIPISVRVQIDFLTSYQMMNVPGQAHRTKDKIKNPDLAYGFLLEQIYDAVGENCEKYIGENKWTVLSSILYNLSDRAPNPRKQKWYWPKVYRLRTDARRAADEKRNMVKVSNDRIKATIAAIQYWHSLVMSLEATVAKGSNDASRIASSAGFFGYILCDRLSSKPGLSKKVPVIVKRITKNLGKIGEICPELTRGNAITVTKYNGMLDNILKKKVVDNEDESA